MKAASSGYCCDRSPSINRGTLDKRLPFCRDRRASQSRAHSAPDWRYACRVGKDIDCELCGNPGGELLWEDGFCRVVRVAGAEREAFPGFCRVVWHEHVAEMSDLPFTEARHLMDVVLATERAVRRVVRSDKINLASLGNVVPHLHWHVIPRWRDDSHFPAPIWAAAKRAGLIRPVPADTSLLHALSTELSTLSKSS
jgi:diadenosine tetraphosphate (Ap4A) HIT family hydrolase